VNRWSCRGADPVRQKRLDGAGLVTGQDIESYDLAYGPHMADLSPELVALLAGPEGRKQRPRGAPYTLDTALECMSGPDMPQVAAINIAKHHRLHQLVDSNLDASAYWGAPDAGRQCR